jgi:single-strand DNA-binding protein
MNHVALVGTLTRDPELRVLSSGATHLTLNLVTGTGVDPAPGPVPGPEARQYHAVVATGELAVEGGRWLGRRQLVAVTGRLITRAWDDAAGRRFWRTEVVADRLEIITPTRQRRVIGA